MPQEPLPHQGTYTVRLLAGLTALAARYPVACIALALAVTLVAVAYTTSELGYRTRRLDLLNPENDYSRLWMEYIAEFGEDDDAVVVVEGQNRDAVVPVLREVSTALADRKHLFSAVLHGVNLQAVRNKGLHYMSPDDLVNLERFLAQADPIVAGDWGQLSLTQMIEGMAARLAMEADRGGAVQPAAMQLRKLTDSLATSIQHRQAYRSPWPEMPEAFATLSELSNEYLLTNEGKLGFVLLRLVSNDDGFARGTEATQALRDLIAQIETRHPEVQIGLTGLPIMENDEMRSSQISSTYASILATGGVALLFVAAFGGMRHALSAIIVLLMGMAWTFGYLTMTVGHLNILSVAFTVTLIGCGIDFGVHYVARYLHLRKQRETCHEALVNTTRSVAPAIWVGAITTAVAFFAAGLTDFPGVAELGIIAGGGILLCAAAVLLVLPAVIAALDRNGLSWRIPEPLPMHLCLQPLMRRPGLVVAAIAIFTVLTSLGASRLWYDHNLLNLQASGLESVELERRLLAECNQSVWYAVSIADDREELLRRKARFLELESVERTEEIVSLLPVDEELKRPIIERVAERLQNLPERPPLIAVDSPELLGQALARTQLLLGRLHQLDGARQVDQLRDTLRRMPLEECHAWMSMFQQQMAGDLLSRLHLLRTMADPEPPTLADLPDSLVDRFVGHNQRYLLKVYGRGNIWDMDALAGFVSDVRTVDPRVTGNPLQAYEAGLDMKRSFEQTAMYAAIVIVLVLWLDFRKLSLVLLAVLPLAAGMAQTFGLLGLLDVPLNPANMIALPLILGIGVDYGVHVVHDFRDQSGRYKISASTVLAMVVSSLTTIVGFGALMIASHRGLQSLGRVLTIGVCCCMFNSLVLLPALFTLLRRNAPEQADEELPQDDLPHDDELPRVAPSRRDGPHLDKALHEADARQHPTARAHG